jgi:glycopeptide antibiotics resistance protein
VIRLASRIPLWVWWIPVVWAASLPLGPTTTPQWHRVHLVPFTDPADKLTDLAVNLLLFVPFGWSFVTRPDRLRWLPLSAGLVSASAELSQLFSTVRYPSGTDVVYAIGGAMAGGVMAHLRSRLSAKVAGHRRAQRCDGGPTC